VETVIDVIESERLLERVQTLSQRIRETCITGPVTAIQGAGLLLGLRTTRPAREVIAALLARDIMAGSSADPHIVRLLPPYILEPSNVDQLATALKEIPA
jgi:acetylornithine/succinyldiaminopimelate/putrescine aminotransferase